MSGMCFVLFKVPIEGGHVRSPSPLSTSSSIADSAMIGGGFSAAV